MTTLRFPSACIRLSLLMVMAVITTGCMGYRVGPVLKANYRSVAVPMFKNETLVPRIEAPITNAVIKQFQSDGALRVEHAPAADLIVTGRITDYSRSALRSLRLDTGVTREYRISITAVVEARSVRDGAVVLKRQKITGSADTFIGTDQQSAELQVLPLVADDIARQLVRMLTEDW